MDPSKPTVLITTSLSEPSDPKNFPVEADEIRHGSYSRGKMTALGGVAVKDAYRAFAATEIIKEDCGSQMGYPETLDKDNIKSYIGGYLIHKGKLHHLTEENQNEFIGQSVLIRSPAFCKADQSGRAFCLKCFGDQLKGHEKSLASYAAEISSVMNTRFMKDMHGSTNNAVKIDFKKAIT